MRKMPCSHPFQSGTVPLTLKGWSMLQYHKILHVHNQTSIYRFQNDILMQWHPLPLDTSLFPHLKVSVNITLILILSNQKAQ